jgi:ubiquinone/menaquinone biosynthesis C-methylase UbiE
VRAPPLTPRAAAALHVPIPERALVVGDGDGEAALFLAREFPAARVRGLDRSADAVRRASARVGLDPEGRVAFKRGRPGALPYPDSHFDLYVGLDRLAALGEATRVLRPGGHLVLVRLRPPRLAGPREALLQRRLSRHGFAVQRAEPAGEGSFLIAKLSS